MTIIIIYNSDYHYLISVLKVKGNGVIPARAAKELDRSRTWSTNWLMRHD